MENFLYGVQIMVVGMTVLFIVLAGMMYSIKFLDVISDKIDARAKAKAEAAGK